MAVQIGTKVRVLGGTFAGRVGVVSELDGKGWARVSLGLMSVRVPVDDLQPPTATNGRTVLRSSHWRPEGAATTRPPAAPARDKKGAPAATNARARVGSDGVDVRESPSRPKKDRPPRRGPGR